MEIKMDYVQQGWQCPICKRVYSPTTTMCMYCGNETKATINTVNSLTINDLTPYLSNHKGAINEA